MRGTPYLSSVELLSDGSSDVPAQQIVCGWLISLATATALRAVPGKPVGAIADMKGGADGLDQLRSDAAPFLLRRQPQPRLVQHVFC